MHLRDIIEGFVVTLMIREGLKKTKKIRIYPYLGWWVGQDGENIHEKKGL